VQAQDAALVADALTSELRRALSGAGVQLTGSESGDAREGQLRQALVAAWTQARAARARVRKGTLLVTSADLAAADAGRYDTLVFAVLSGAHGRPGQREGVPLPPDLIVPSPDDRPEYDVPSAREFTAGGVELELLVVSAKTGELLAQRRVAHPAHTRDGILQALPIIVREVSRGLQGG
jgi:hypothetical protein